MLGSSASGQICVSHTQRRPRHECNQDTTDVMTATPVWHFSKSFCKNEMRPSSQVRIRHRLRGKSACLFRQFQHERDRATPLPRWSFPEAAASVAFAIVTDNDVGTPTVRRSEDWRGPTITQRCRPAGGRVAVVSMTSSLLLVRLHERRVRDLNVWVTIMNRRTYSCSSPVPACDDGFPY